MKKYFIIITILIVCILILGIVLLILEKPMTTSIPLKDGIIQLPEPSKTSDISIEQALAERRSVRSYSKDPLSLQDVSQLVWAAQGITQGAYRTAPSAGALYPLEIYVVVGNVQGLEQGVYKYNPEEHVIEQVNQGDMRQQLQQSSLNQSSVGDGAIDIVIAGVFERTTKKYGERGNQYVYMEAGHAAQNIYLQAVSLDLGTVTIGAFDEPTIQKILDMNEDEIPLYIMPIGKK